MFNEAVRSFVPRILASRLRAGMEIENCRALIRPTR